MALCTAITSHSYIVQTDRDKSRCCSYEDKSLCTLHILPVLWRRGVQGICVCMNKSPLFLLSCVHPWTYLQDSCNVAGVHVCPFVDNFYLSGMYMDSNYMNLCVCMCELYWSGRLHQGSGWMVLHQGDPGAPQPGELMILKPEALNASEPEFYSNISLTIQKYFSKFLNWQSRLLIFPNTWIQSL